MLLRARVGDGSTAPSLRGLGLDGSPVPLGLITARDLTETSKSVWAWQKSFEALRGALKHH